MEGHLPLDKCSSRYCSQAETWEWTLLWQCCLKQPVADLWALWGEQELSPRSGSRPQHSLANPGLSSCSWMILLMLLVDSVVQGGIWAIVSFCCTVPLSTKAPRPSTSQGSTPETFIPHTRDIHFPTGGQRGERQLLPSPSSGTSPHKAPGRC